MPPGTPEEPPSDSYSPKCLEDLFSEVRSPLLLVTVVVTFGRRSYARVELWQKGQSEQVEE
jgi:hypothetical protein